MVKPWSKDTKCPTLLRKNKDFKMLPDAVMNILQCNMFLMRLCFPKYNSHSEWKVCQHKICSPSLVVRLRQAEFFAKRVNSNS